MNIKRSSLAATILSVAIFSAPVFAEDWKGETKDAWIDGKLESSYLINTELNNFKIDTSVKDGHVVLSGDVPTEAHKGLAEEIAKNLDGVKDVKNNLQVSSKSSKYSDNDRKFSTRFYDMTTTVALKSKFALNKELDALDIHVDTENGVVTLDGKVASKAESMMAEEIASGSDYVSSVNNKLRIVVSN